MVNLKTLRPSPALQRFASKYLLPLIGSTDPPRRGNRVFPDEAPNPRRVTTTPSGSRSRTGMGTTPSTETRSQSPTVHSPLSLSNATAAAPSVLNQWVDELTGRGQASGVRVPTSDEISLLSSMFPEASRDLIVRTLQRR